MNGRPPEAIGRSASDPEAAEESRPGPTAAELAVLGDRIYCDDELGLAWRPVEQLPDEAVRARTNARNETVLRALAMLEERDASQQDDAERAELHRLEGKLDLVLELMSELVRERQGAVAPWSVRFNARGLCWDCDEAVPVVGALLAVDCYVLPPWPLPLRLYCRVAQVEAGARLSRVCAEIEGLNRAVTDWLGKLVFRRHRRTIAQRRQRA